MDVGIAYKGSLPDQHMLWTSSVITKKCDLITIVYFIVKIRKTQTIRHTKIQWQIQKFSEEVSGLFNMNISRKLVEVTAQCAFLQKAKHEPSRGSGGMHPRKS